MSNKPPSTPLKRSSSLEMFSSSSAIYLKLEGRNETGTHKDRAGRLVAEKAAKLGFKLATCGTCGSFGAALAYHCSQYRVSCTVFIPETCEQNIRDRITGLGATLIAVRGTYEDAVVASQHFALRYGYFDANANGPEADLLIRAYTELAQEIFAQLSCVPKSIWVPAGNGTTALGIARAIQQRNASTLLGIVGSRGNTAVTASLLAGRTVCLDPNSIQQTPTNSPLVNHISAQTEELLEKSSTVGCVTYEVSDFDLHRAQCILRQCGEVPKQPASAASVAGFLAWCSQLPATQGIHVLILTS